jgi:glycosyltransferase involved in cell wall biosynthesis
VSLERLTPVVLSFNEEVNLPRTLSSLRWAKRIVVVDSGSTDASKALATAFPNVAWFERPFDGYAGQWSYGFSATAIATPFVLALDADMEVPPDLRDELASLLAENDCDGAFIRFAYRVNGARLWRSLYPAQCRLLRRDRGQVLDDGHAARFSVSGRVRTCRARLVHDDRKPLERWLASQARYSRIEADRLSHRESRGGLKDALRRRLPGWPSLVGLLAYVRAGGPWYGAAARRYALERLIYEALLRWRLADRELTRERQKSNQ